MLAAAWQRLTSENYRGWLLSANSFSLYGLLICVLAVSGCGSGGAGSDSSGTQVQDLPPSLAITSPADGDQIVSGAAFLLSADATDAEDGSLVPAVQWSSSLAGSLGTGDLQVNFLQPGLHTISASVNDSGGNAIGTTIQLDVLPNNPPTINVNSGALVGEGTAYTLGNSDLSIDDDVDGADAIMLMVDIPPAFGTLSVAGDPDRAVFYQADIDAGRVVYEHRRGSSATDTMVFTVTDSASNELRSQQFEFDVLPNIQPPLLAYVDNEIQLEWLHPSDSLVERVVVRRSDDGRYPASLGEGSLVIDSDSGTQQVVQPVAIDSSAMSQPVYFTLFSVSSDGTVSQGMRIGLFCHLGDCVVVPDLRDLLDSEALADVDSFRRSLIQVIWGTDTLPSGLPGDVTEIPPDSRLPNATAAYIPFVDLGSGVTSEMRFYVPSASNGQLVIYHQGHRGNTNARWPILDRFLSEGFHVLEISMPFSGYNFMPDLFGVIEAHDEYIPTLPGNPMRYFLEPVAVGLNYALTQQNFTAIYLTGISGGGWTTAIYGALDDRIDALYEVAGSYPFYLREQIADDEGNFNSIGDFEQSNPEFYQHASYLDFYVLGAAGRRMLQVFNVYDNCCFEGTYSLSYESFVAEEAAASGGQFRVLIDASEVGHVYSQLALETVLSDIATQQP